MGGKKKWIDKKNATTFSVVNRGGGPREVAPTGEGSRPAAEKVLMPMRPRNLRGKDWAPGIRFDDDDGWSDEEGAPKAGAGGAGPVHGKAGEVGVRVGNFRPDDYELGEYGFPDDGYDYSQHFSTMGGGKFLPASMMGDKTAAIRAGQAVKVDFTDKPPTATLDFNAGGVLVVKSDVSVVEKFPVVKHQFSDAEEEEVMKLLDESASEEAGWELQDNFVADAMEDEAAARPSQTTSAAGTAAKGVRFADAQFEDDDDEDSDFDERNFEDDDDEDEHDGRQPTRVGGVPHFEERDGGTAVDAWLTHMMENDYNDEMIGEGALADAYSNSEHRAKVHSNQLMDLMDQFLDAKAVPSHEAYHDGDAIDVVEQKKTLELAQLALGAPDEVVMIEVVKRDAQWDCESVLSTYVATWFCVLRCFALTSARTGSPTRPIIHSCCKTSRVVKKRARPRRRRRQ
jgi:hypothetical protein